MSAARDPTRESLSAELGSSALSCPFVARDIVREVDRERKDSVHAAWVRFESGEMTREQLEIILSIIVSRDFASAVYLGKTNCELAIFL